MTDYPEWVCWDCGFMAQPEKWRIVDSFTMHRGVCGVCGEEADVTQPRDFGYPEFEEVE